MQAARQRAALTGYAGRGTYYDIQKGQGFPHPLPLMRDDEVVEVDSDQRRLTTLYTELALEFVEANRERPFFLYLPYAMPHVPLFVSNQRWGRSLRGRYGDVIEELDWSVGQILDKLRDLGLDRNTLVVYTSDNGPWLQYGIDAGSAGPFRDGQSDDLGRRRPRPGGLLDAGLDPCRTRELGGGGEHGLAADLRGPSGVRSCRTIACSTDATSGPLLSGATDESPHEYFYYFAGSPPGQPPRLQAVRAGRHKLRLRRTASGAYESAELFDLYADAGERFDIRERHPGLVETLLAVAERFARELEADARPLGGTGD